MFGQSGSHDSQTLIERKAGCTRMPSQLDPLLLCRVETKLKRSVPRHLASSFAGSTDNPLKLWRAASAGASDMLGGVHTNGRGRLIKVGV